MNFLLTYLPTTSLRFLTGDQLKRKKNKVYAAKKKTDRLLTFYLEKERRAKRTVDLGKDDHSMIDGLYSHYVTGKGRSKLDQFLDNPENNCTRMKKFFEEQVVHSHVLKPGNSKLKHGNRWSDATIRILLAVEATSPKAYEHLANSGVLVLPNKRTLQRVISENKTSPGVDYNKANDYRVSWLEHMKHKKSATVVPSQYGATG